jgi:hypothetical protein
VSSLPPLRWGKSSTDDALHPAASELLLMLLHVAQWDVCCDSDEAAAAAQADGQAQLLFQGLGASLAFMNEERLSIPRVHRRSDCFLLS